MACFACMQRSSNENAIKILNSRAEPFDEDDKDLVFNKTMKIVRKPGSHHESVESTSFLKICNNISNQFPHIDDGVISIPSIFVPPKNKHLKTNETDQDILDLFEKKTRLVETDIDHYISTKL